MVEHLDLQGALGAAKGFCQAVIEEGKMVR